MTEPEKEKELNPWMVTVPPMVFQAEDMDHALEQWEDRVSEALTAWCVAVQILVDAEDSDD